MFTFACIDIMVIKIYGSYRSEKNLLLKENLTIPWTNTRERVKGDEMVAHLPLKFSRIAWYCFTHSGEISGIGHRRCEGIESNGLVYKTHPWFLAQNLSKKVRLIHKSLRWYRCSKACLKTQMNTRKWNNQLWKHQCTVKWTLVRSSLFFCLCSDYVTQ